MDIIELAETEGLKVIKRGSCYMTFCIFHQESKPSLQLDHKRGGGFYCHGCGAKGSIFDFYAQIKGITRDQVKEALQHENIDIKTTQARPEHRRKTRERGLYSHIYKAFIDYLQQQNKNKPDQEALNYLHQERLLTDETIRLFRISILPDSQRDRPEYRKLKEYLQDHFTLEELRACGLMGQNNTRLQLLKHRIIIPLIENFAIMGLKRRFFYKGQAETPEAKYITQPAGFIKGFWFNGDILKMLEPGDKVIICEGEFDTMLCQQVQIEKKRQWGVVGIPGIMNWTPEGIKQLEPYKVTIALHNEQAGREAATKIYRLLGEEKVEKIITYDWPEGCDLTDYLHMKGYKPQGET